MSAPSLGVRSRIFLRKRLRVILLAGTTLFIIVEIVALSPASLEEGSGSSAMVEPETLVRNEGTTLATGIPKDKIPDYSVDQFNYVSTQNSVKQWKLVADKAFLYNHQKLVHSRVIKAFLYNPDGSTTIVTGKEAKYYLNERDLEIYGDVKTVFPDGFVIDSQYMQYHPQTKKIDIPTTYPVSGGGEEKPGQMFTFQSRGLKYQMGKSEIDLPEAARVTFIQTPSADEKSDHPGVPEKTIIESDRCLIDRKEQLAHFTMERWRPSETRFVLITQPKLYARGRRADLNYGDFSKVIHYLVAYEDVLIKERQTGARLKYSTSGRADFDTKRDVIVLTEFPQAYQDNDTVTGDVILLHRDTDVVEVEHSNAFSEGQ